MRKRTPARLQCQDLRHGHEKCAQWINTDTDLRPGTCRSGYSRCSGRASWWAQRKRWGDLNPTWHPVPHGRSVHATEGGEPKFTVNVPARRGINIELSHRTSIHTQCRNRRLDPTQWTRDLWGKQILENAFGAAGAMGECHRRPAHDEEISDNTPRTSRSPSAVNARSKSARPRRPSPVMPVAGPAPTGTRRASGTWPAPTPMPPSASKATDGNHGVTRNRDRVQYGGAASRWAKRCSASAASRTSHRWSSVRAGSSASKADCRSAPSHRYSSRDSHTCAGEYRRPRKPPLMRISEGSGVMICRRTQQNPHQSHPAQHEWSWWGLRDRGGT